MNNVSIYLINEVTRDPEGGDAPEGWFEERCAAQAECDRLNAERRARGLDDNYQVDEEEAVSYAAARARAESAKAAALAAARLAFIAGCRELFGASPGLQSFGWKQYTRYSARDEMFEFNVYGDDPDVNGVEGGEVGETSPEGALQAEVAELLKSFEEADLGALFGDDVAVTVRRGGAVEVEEYVDDDYGCYSNACSCEWDDSEEDDEDE